jgi:putative RecB family exonuclease
MTVEATPFVKKYAPWSASKADCAEQCPLKFRFSYVHKVERGRPGEEALVGTTVHRILELAMGGKSLEEAIDSAVNDPKVKILTVERQKIDALIPNVSTFIRRTQNFIEKQGGAEILLEGRLAASYDNKPRKFFDNSSLFRGVVDIGLLFKSCPHIMVIDHKTGKNRGIEYYSWQFLTYTYMAKVVYPHLTHVIPCVHWVQDGYTDVGNIVPVPDVVELQDRIITHLNRATREAAECLDVGKPSKLCGWCDFSAVCPVKGKSKGLKNHVVNAEDVNQ